MSLDKKTTWFHSKRTTAIQVHPVCICDSSFLGKMEHFNSLMSTSVRLWKWRLGFSKQSRLLQIMPDHASPRRRRSSERVMLSVALVLAQRQQNCDEQQQSATHTLAAPSTAAAAENGSCTYIQHVSNNNMLVQNVLLLPTSHSWCCNL